VALASFRSVARAPSHPSDTCAELEPAIAAMVAGTIHRLELGRLVQHLGDCVVCSDVASRLTFFRPELDGIPDPVAPQRHASASATAPPDRGETTAIRRQPRPGETNGLASRARRTLRELLPPRPRRLLWAAQIAAAACLAAAAGFALGREPAPIAAVGEPVTPVTRKVPAGGPELGHAIERAVDAEARARDAEARLVAAEARLEQAQRKLALLEPTAPELKREANPPPKPDKKSAPEAPTAPFAPSQVSFGPPVSVGTPHTPAPEPPPGDQGEGAMGFLTIVCNPFCDDIADEGKSLGPSPVVRASVKPGLHRVRLRRKGFLDKTISVQVVAGQMSTQRVSMKSPIARDERDQVDGGQPATDFHRGMATSAIANAVRGCGRSAQGDTRGAVVVTFGESGSVTSAVVPSPWSGTPLGSCISSSVRAVQVPPFSGGPVTVSVPVVIAGPANRDPFGARR
jgi:hypothetical protein